MKRFLLAALFALFGASAEAQVPSGCPYPLQYGQVLTTAEWNACIGGIVQGFTGGRLTSELILAPSTNINSGLNYPIGVAPGTPAAGDIWMTSAGLFYNNGIATYGPILPGGSSGQVQINNGTGGWGGITNAQLTALINSFSTSLSGAAPASGGGTVNFLRADGTWAVPPGVSSGGTVTSITNSDGTITLSPNPITITGSASLNLGNNNNWSAAQRGAFQPLTISGSTFTPSFDSGQNISVTLVHASCPCTFANPSTTPVAGQAGVIEIVQSSTGSDLISTWGSDYVTNGHMSSIALSSGANAIDVFSYIVLDSTHITLTPGVLNVVH